MIFLFSFICAMAIITYRDGGPAFVLTAAWIISISPIVFGVVNYGYLDLASNRYIWIIFLGLGCYFLGAAGARFQHAPLLSRQPDDYILKFEYLKWVRTAYFCIFISVCSIFFMIISFVIKGSNIEDLTSIREQVVNIDRAGIIERLAAITTWACFFCALFGWHFRKNLGFLRGSMFIACAAGAVLASITSAGRQSILQLVLLLYFVQSFGVDSRLNEKARVAVFQMTSMIIGFSLLIYITLNRGSAMVHTDRATYLLGLFHAHFNNQFNSWLGNIGPDFREFVIESTLYISHTIPLFSISTELEFGERFHGALSFPFLLRQLQPVLDVDVGHAFILKARYISTTDVIGVGWDTGLSSPLLDFGLVGLAVFMLVQGYLAQWIWMRAKATGEFGAILLGVIMVVAAAYSPFLFLFSETNMFLLLTVVVVLFIFLGGLGKKATYRRQ